MSNAAVRLAEIEQVLQGSFRMMEKLHETEEDYNSVMNGILWVMGYPDAIDHMGEDDAEVFLMEYFEDFMGKRPEPIKKWQITLH